MISVIMLKFEMDLGRVFMVYFVTAEQHSVAQVRCLSSSSAAFFSKIKHDGRLLYSPLLYRQAVLRGGTNRGLK